MELPKATKELKRENGENGRDSKPEKAHCLTGAANLYGRW